MSTVNTFCLVATLLLPAALSHAQTMSYPAKPVRIIVATPPGGPYDETARAIGPRLTAIWGQQVIVDNRPGAANIIGATTAAKSPPDGYTFFLANVASQAITPALRKNLPYDPQRDFAPVTLMLSSPLVIVVHPSMPAKTIRDLVNLARARPGSLNYASAGVGNLQHLAMEMLQSAAAIRMNHVPYKGSAQASVDLIAGHVDLMFANIAGAMVHIKGNRIRAIAVSAAKGSTLLPDLPAVAKTYPQFDVTTWMALLAPAGTPRDIINKVSADVNRVLKSADMQERFVSLGQEVIAGPPEQVTEYARRDGARYAAIIREINLAPE
ncbi:MAG: tripartite tricarboxylate transporter substrate binding protein [Betaproteobacteria bacterium]|jgi:tripartite-type tricarboxylate transporter receptor subunit TctC